MTWTSPDIIQAALVALLIAIIVFSLWRKLRENEALKYEFITIIAHKFRTPLTRIKWLLDDLVKSERDPYRRQNLAELGTENESLVKLIGTLVELTDAPGSKNSSYRFERIDLCAFVRETFNGMNRSFQEKNISVSLDFALPQIFVRADRSRLEFVLSTLLENARIYTPANGKAAIVITAKRRKTAVSVVDSGIGIASADMPHIFSRFFRAKNARSMDTEGLGVGLYLARSVVKRHHGKLQAFSAGPNSGSTFSLILRRVK